jgi:hypothetical protein
MKMPPSLTTCFKVSERRDPVKSSRVLLLEQSVAPTHEGLVLTDEADEIAGDCWGVDVGVRDQ